MTAMKLLTVSKLLTDIGLENLDIGYLFIGILVFIAALLVCLIVQTVKINKLKERLDKFVLGKDGKSLEKDIAALYEDNKFLKSTADRNKKDIRILYKSMESAFQKIGVVKYDAFRQMGGSLSFCLALLNENDDGFIMNSVHSTDGCYTYTKVIKNGKCDLDLGAEEKKALSIAMGE